MRRRLIQLVVFLLLGAVVNVAVAWDLNLIPFTDSGVTFLYSPGEGDLEWWRTNAPIGFPAQPAGVFEHRKFGRQTLLMYEQEADENSITLGDNVARFRCGLPCWSMESATWVNRKASSVVEQNRSYIPRGWPLAGRWVSVKPLSFGLAVNTMFYTAILWLLSAATGKLRRWRRIKRGLCTACAYPIGSSDVCTECGAAVIAKGATKSAGTFS